MTRMTPAERTVAAQVRAVEETRVWPRETNTYWHLRGGNLVRGCRACRAAIDRVAKDRKTAKRHRRHRCDRGHDWETNKRVSRAGRVYCHLCRVETGRMRRG